MSHFRYEWIYEVGALSTISYTKVGRDGQEETGRTHAFYARHRHANGNIMEIVIAADAADALPPLVTRAAQMSAAANPSLRFDAAPSAARGARFAEMGPDSDENRWGCAVLPACAVLTDDVPVTSVGSRRARRRSAGGADRSDPDAAREQRDVREAVDGVGQRFAVDLDSERAVWPAREERVGDRH